MLLLNSCAPVKRSVEASVDHRRDAQTSETVQAELARRLQHDRVLTLDDNEVLIRRILEYDTTQPADSIRGKPPLKREIVEERRRRVQAQQTDSIREQTDSSSVHKIDTHNKEDTLLEITTTEKRGSSWVLRALAAAGVAALVLLAWWIYKHIKSKILW